jgi:hypothetical protein
VIRNYIDWVLNVALERQERADQLRPRPMAERILDEDHYGLVKVKERILEHLAVQALAGKKRKGPDALPRRSARRRQDLPRAQHRAGHGRRAFVRLSASGASETRRRSADTAAPISEPCPAGSSRIAEARSGS